jgi:hypothetical protein
MEELSHQIVVLTDIGDIDEVYDLDSRGRHTTQLPRQPRRNLNGMTGSAPPSNCSTDEIAFLLTNANEGMINHRPNVVHLSQTYTHQYHFTSLPLNGYLIQQNHSQVQLNKPTQSFIIEKFQFNA